MKNGRPYPPDKEQRVRVRIELARRDMTISDLARTLNISRESLSSAINGTRRSPKTEEKIAAYFGMARKDLFKWGDRIKKTYPPDKKRRIRVRIELVRRDMTIGDLARALEIKQQLTSAVISGTLRPKDIEDQIASCLGKSWQELFREES
jgi:plasmid maintenance system antidote protein VapI